MTQDGALGKTGPPWPDQRPARRWPMAPLGDLAAGSKADSVATIARTTAGST